jgi:hypothetical protein
MKEELETGRDKSRARAVLIGLSRRIGTSFFGGEAMVESEPTEENQ